MWHASNEASHPVELFESWAIAISLIRGTDDYRALLRLGIDTPINAGSQ